MRESNEKQYWPPKVIYPVTPCSDLVAGSLEITQKKVSVSAELKRPAELGDVPAGEQKERRRGKK